ncbi:MAG: preprotein translocase subunit SecY [Oligoflexales bacterium]|nr:preprotein translocase subunit SecY [Oligoflexales bacterium]
MAHSIQKLPEGRLNHLQKKILYTLFFLALYRIGVHIPIPGVDTYALGEFFRSQGANFFGMFNMFSGGALQNFSVFALGVIPYISASIAAQILTVAIPHLEMLSKEGEAGRKKITQYTRYGTIVLTLVQGYMMATSLEKAQFIGGSLVIKGGLGWRLMTVLSLTAGTAFVMWLGEQITERGVGNGISLIIFVGIVSGLPNVITNTYTRYTTQQMDLFRILLVCVICVLIVAGVVYMEQGSRQIPIQYAKRQVGRKIYGGQSSNLPMRVNSAGVIPPIFANSLLQFPMFIKDMAPNSWFGTVMNSIFTVPGDWVYNTVYVSLIIFFSYFYTTIVFKADDVAEQLKKHGGFIPGIRPGARTAEYLQKILERLTLTGAIYLSAICVVPTILTGKFDVQFTFGGTSLLIVVGVALETFRQIDAHRQSLRYEGFLKQGAIRPRRGSSV